MAQLCRPRSAILTLRRQLIPRASKAQANAQLPPLSNSNFSSRLLSHREVVDKCRDESFGPNTCSFEATEDVPQPTSCCSLTIFTFHSCGGGRSTSTLRTCRDGLQNGCSGCPIVIVVVIMYTHILWPIMYVRTMHSCCGEATATTTNNWRCAPASKRAMGKLRERLVP